MKNAILVLLLLVTVGMSQFVEPYTTSWNEFTVEDYHGYNWGYLDYGAWCSWIPVNDSLVGTQEWQVTTSRQIGDEETLIYQGTGTECSLTYRDKLSYWDELFVWYLKIVDVDVDTIVECSAPLEYEYSYPVSITTHKPVSLSLVSEDETVNIFTVTGKLVATMNHTNINDINTSTLSAGIYIATIQSLGVVRKFNVK